MLYLIGTGLYYLTDMPLRAMDILSDCEEIYLERYTNLNDIHQLNAIEEKLSKKVTLISRDIVESDFIIKRSASKRVAMLVPGDPLSATTHTTLLMDCKENGVDYEIVHASSIFTSIAETGLSLYKFGATCSIPIFTESFKPESFFDVIESNLKTGLHTLVLLEVKDEKRFVSAKTALAIIKEIEAKRKLKVIDWKNVIGLSKLGSTEQRIFLTNSNKNEYKPPLCLIIPSVMNTVEKENIKTFVRES